LNTEGPFMPQDMGFDFAFKAGDGLEESIGHITVKMVEFYYSDERKEDGSKKRLKKKVDLPFEECGTEHFNYEN